MHLKLREKGFLLKKYEDITFRKDVAQNRANMKTGPLGKNAINGNVCSVKIRRVVA